MKINKDEQYIIDIAYKAGEIALREQLKLTIETKSDNSLVSSGDLAVNDFLFKELSSITKNILSEEQYELENINKDDLVFVIDPIDGTESYTKKEDTWSILIALVKNNITIFSVVYQPSKDKLFYASLGKGAYLLSNKVTKQLKIDSKANKGVISPSLIESEIETVKKYTNDYYILPSAGLKIMEVVINNAIVYPNYARKCGIWDLLAPVLILQESGGHIELNDKLDLTKPHIDFDFIVKGKK